MALYPGAQKLLLPENRFQAKINPTQFVAHSIIAPWTIRRTYEYWRDSTNLESHFGIDYTGAVGQYIDTGRRADANAYANNWALSVETASNTKGTDPWTDAQMESLLALMLWVHKTHKIPARMAPSYTTPGFGYHKLHRKWSMTGTDCPGVKRTAQFVNDLMPALRKAAAPKPAPPKLPGVSLKAVKFAATHRASEEPESGRRDVRYVQDALVATGHLRSGNYDTAVFDVRTKEAYQRFQVTLYGKGPDSDGVPGQDSLTRLGQKVTAMKFHVVP